MPGKMIVEFFSAYSNLEKRCGNIYIYDLMCLDVVSIIYSPISCSRFANTSTAKKMYVYIIVQTNVVVIYDNSVSQCFFKETFDTHSILYFF